MLSKKWAILALIVFVGPIILAACEGETVEVTRVVTEKETVVVTEKEEVQVEVTSIVKEEVEVVVTATPVPAEPKVLVIASPEQYSETFDVSTMIYAMEPTHMIYDTLVSVDHNYEYQPGALTGRWRFPKTVPSSPFI